MLNENIKKLRSQRGFSQVELGRRLGVTKQSISNWENNYIQPSIEMLVRISHVFSVSTDSLLGLDTRKYIEITNLTDEEVSHLQLIAKDIANIRKYK